MALINFQESSKWRALYEKAKEQYWQPETIDCVSDKNQWHKLDSALKSQVLNLLQYAILLDSFQVENLAEISGTMSEPMLKALMAFHGLMEAVHSQSYSYWAETVCTPAEKEFLYTETSATKARLKVYHELNEEHGDLIANYFLEGVSFQALFRLSDLLKSQGLLPGLSAILNLIKRDEDTHIVTFQHLIKNSPSLARVKAAFDEAAEKESQIVFEITGDSTLANYVYYASDMRLKALGLTIELRPNPFAGLEGINDTTKQKLKANFFTSNVMYSARDESLDWNYSNWFNEVA
jgi:ribonucleotide reductase beta subunit family protein with ferritin-like domain